MGGGGGSTARTRTPPSNGVAAAATTTAAPAAAAAGRASPMDPRSLTAAVREATSGEPSAPATAAVATAVGGLTAAVAASPVAAADGVFRALYRRPLSKHPLVAFRSASLLAAMLAAAPAGVAPVVGGQAPFLSWVETTWARGGGGDAGDPDGSSPHPLAYCFAGGEVAAFAALIRGVATTLVANPLLTSLGRGGPAVDRAAAAAMVEAVRVQVVAAASLATRLAPASDACAGAKAAAVGLLVRGTRVAVAAAVRVAGPQGAGVAALEGAAVPLWALGGKRRGGGVHRGILDSSVVTEDRAVHLASNGGASGVGTHPSATSGGDDKDAVLRAAFASGGGWASGGGSGGGDGSGSGGGDGRDVAEDDEERAVRRAKRKAARREARASAAAAAAENSSAALGGAVAAEIESGREPQHARNGSRQHHRSDTSSSTTTPTTSSADPTSSASNGHGRQRRHVASTDASSSPSSGSGSDSSSSSSGSSSSSSGSSSSDGDDSSSSVERRRRRNRRRRPGSSTTSHSADERRRRPSSAVRRAARASSSDERSSRSARRTKSKRGTRPPKQARPPVPPVGTGLLAAATPAGKTPAMNTAFEIPPHAVRFGAQVGSGGFGVVFKGVYAGETVAIKKIHAHALGNAGAVAEFQAEVAVLSSVRHPNIVRFVGACTLPPALMIVTEFLERGTLFDVLHGSKEPVGWRERRGMMVGLCEGMTYLHSRGLLHRDLKVCCVEGESSLEGVVLSVLTRFGGTGARKRWRCLCMNASCRPYLLVIDTRTGVASGGF